MGQRHAFLIMAHDEYDLLETLVTLLDDPRADIFIHIDARAADAPDLAAHALHSRVTMLPRSVVRWSGFSQVAVELRLIGAAISGKYDYYHLLSGHCLPVTSHDYLYDFFRANEGTEFVDCWATPENGRFTELYRSRVKYFTLAEPRTRDAVMSRAANRAAASGQVL